MLKLMPYKLQNICVYVLSGLDLYYLTHKIVRLQNSVIR